MHNENTVVTRATEVKQWKLRIDVITGTEMNSGNKNRDGTRSAQR